MRIDPNGNFGIFLAIAALFLFTPVGGIVTQTAVSTLSYLGMAVASIWDKDIRADIVAIGWNPFNADETAVLSSNKVSFYLGMPVIFINGNRSGSFYAIFMNKSHGVTTLRHERGHGWQAMIMGVGTYILTVGIPSPLMLGPWNAQNNYYGAPWETLADILGGARSHNQEETLRAWLYYVVSLLNPGASYFFLLWD